ncbi:diacylglycerol kinase family protein [Halostagnicola sp. A-GB9-2]|uniref:diacylglycerol/lipid kinase family protein n=1 Tax=Halostagnicola sp. A-GB9-2 TaxID=3048066 RepID=UPI0024BFE53C|nr:diacylglycerol kinase family protein [Halostagnicola sp. A-GB9-2]MDJ1434171.1 diacylglycerol kinase family protein [Halostagnicola sp. A-GB9-2]
MDTTVNAGERRLLILNPVSGSEDHVDTVVELAEDHGFEVRTTEGEGDAKRIARKAAAETDLVAAAGGDGTVNEVVNGMYAADALSTTTVAVVPAGTGNNFATNIGVEGIDHAFDVIRRDRRRTIDLGTAEERAFVNSCVAGVTAEASGATTSSGKRQFGVLAYVFRTIENVRSFDSLPLRVETDAGSESTIPRTDPNAEPRDESVAQTWEGDAAFVLVGNARRFTSARTAQGNAEDGLLEVTVVEDASAVDLLGDAMLEGMFGRDAEHIVRLRASALTIESLDDSPVTYSLDGETLKSERVNLETDCGALRVIVGDGYDPNPDSDEA